LLLIDLNQRGKIVQEIRNIKGLISLNELIEIVEFQSNLFLFDSEGQLTKLDINGTLISQVKLDAKDMAASDNRIWLLQQNELFLYSELENPALVCQMPAAQIDCFRSNSDRFYFQVKNKIYCYNLVKKK
jgi:hypothetical protein